MIEDELKMFLEWLAAKNILVSVVEFDRPWCGSCDDAHGGGEECIGHLVDDAPTLAELIEQFRDPEVTDVPVVLTTDEIARLEYLYNVRDDVGGDSPVDTALFEKLEAARATALSVEE